MQFVDDYYCMPQVLPCMAIRKQHMTSGAEAGAMPSQYAMPQYAPGVLPEQQYMAPGTAPGMMPGQYITPQCMPDMAADAHYTYPQNVPGALQLIKEAVAGETEDRMFYEYLISVAPSEEDKNIIRGIRDNEISHFALFRQIYCELTGQTLPFPEEVEFERPASYCEGLKRAIQGEQSAVIRYRKILFALQNRVQINKLTEIITDEIRHGSLYNYLYAKNGCRV